MPKALPPDTRDRILAAAERRLTHYGFGKTTVEEIARDVGISKGAVYLHFRTKEDLGLAIVEKHFHHSILAFEAFLAATRAPAPVLLKSMMLHGVRSALGYVRHHPHAVEVAEAIFARRPEPLIPLVEREKELWQSVLERGAADGEFRSIDAETTARLLGLALTPYYPPYTWLDSLDEVMPLADATLDLLLNSLMKPEPAQPATPIPVLSLDPFVPEEARR